MKRILRTLISKAEVHDTYRPERKRPFARLVLRGELEGILILASEPEIQIGGSPGGLSTLLIPETGVSKVSHRRATSSRMRGRMLPRRNRSQAGSGGVFRRNA